MKIATHSDPVWRSRANFLIMADLSDTGLQDHLEQLWAEQIDEHEFLLCCIPFFTYNLSLGERVRTYSTGEREYVIEAIIARSQRRVYRLWLEGTSDEGRREVKSYLKSEALLHEWRSEDFVAFDVPSEEQAVQYVEPALDDLKSRFNLLFERGG